jgi:lipoyl(octanoyl) transferase
MSLVVRDLGRMRYGPAFELQQRLNQQVIDGEAPATLLLVEHEPVITVTPRKGVRDHLVASEQVLDRLGIELCPTNRGGDITYHGPGQLVAYPILRLGDFDLNLGRYMRVLEEAVIRTVARWDVIGQREPGATGVWVQGSQSPVPVPGPPAPGAAKLCAMGVRVRKNVTMHGLALNVDPDLTHFATIVPCGLAGRAVTSLRALLGDRCPAMPSVKQELAEQLQRILAGREAEAER